MAVAGSGRSGSRVEPVADTASMTGTAWIARSCATSARNRR